MKMKHGTINLKQVSALRRKDQSRRVAVIKRETTVKKNTFVRGTVRRLTMNNANVMCGK